MQAIVPPQSIQANSDLPRKRAFRRRILDTSLKAQPGWLLDEKIVLHELCALHLLAHPHGRHSAARPLQRFVLLALILRLGLGTFPRARHPHHGPSNTRCLLGNVTLELGELAFESVFLPLNLLDERAFEAADIVTELTDIHALDRASEFCDRARILRTRGTFATLLSHDGDLSS